MVNSGGQHWLAPGGWSTPAVNTGCHVCRLIRAVTAAARQAWFVRDGARANTTSVAPDTAFGVDRQSSSPDRLVRSPPCGSGPRCSHARRGQKAELALNAPGREDQLSSSSEQEAAFCIIVLFVCHKAGWRTGARRELAPPAVVKMSCWRRRWRVGRRHPQSPVAAAPAISTPAPPMPAVLAPSLAASAAGETAVFAAWPLRCR